MCFYQFLIYKIMNNSERVILDSILSERLLEYFLKIFTLYDFISVTQYKLCSNLNDLFIAFLFTIFIWKTIVHSIVNGCCEVCRVNMFNCSPFNFSFDSDILKEVNIYILQRKSGLIFWKHVFTRFVK